MPKVKSEKYIFATARVRGNENNLLTHEKMEKMLDAKTPEEAMKILIDCSYGDGAADVPARDFELLLKQEQEKTNAFIRQIAPEPAVFDMFLYPYDYHNLKVLLKAEYLGSDPEPMLLDAGTIPVAKLRAAVTERNLSILTEEMQKAFHEILDQFAKTGDPQIIDILFDRAYFVDIAKIARQCDSSYVKGYVCTLIDTTNLKTFARVKKMGKSWDFFAKVFVEGGNIPRKRFIEGFENSLEQFAESLAAGGYDEGLALGAQSLKETNKFTEFERQCDNMLISYVKNAKYVPYGIEPLIGFMVAKDNEMKQARIIMSGKLNNLPADEIRGRLRETYV